METGHYLVTNAPELSDRGLLAARQQMRVALDELDARPAALNLQPQQILVDGVVPCP